MTAAHAALLQSAAQLLWCGERDRPLTASQHHRDTSSRSRSCLCACAATHLAGAVARNAMQPAELDTLSSWSYAVDEAKRAGPLDMPPSLRLGPRVEHVNILRDGSIVELLSEALKLPQVVVLHRLPRYVVRVTPRTLCHQRFLYTDTTLHRLTGLCSAADRVWRGILLPNTPPAAASNRHKQPKWPTAARRCSCSPASRRSAPWQGCAC
jgi:hypothetical protein